MADIQEKREQWKKEQARLRNLLRTTEPKGFIENLQFIGGVDISFVKNTDKALACLSVLEYPSLELVETFYHPCIMTEPYMPGFLGFREVGHLVEVVNMFLKKYPRAKDHFLIMVDGNGILHYRRFGSASHLGVVLGIPTIGVGKELLVVDGMDADAIAEQCISELKQFGDQIDLIGPSTGRLYGRAVRTKSAHEPIYVSIGHMISLDTAIDLVLKCSKNGSLLPEPVRLADGLSRDIITKNPGLTKFFPKKPSPSPSSSSPSSSSASRPLSSYGPPPPKKGSSEKAAWDPKNGYERDARAILDEKRKLSEIGATPPEKGKGKRDAYWACDCGANNPIQRDACDFCYHSRKVPTAHDEPPEKGNTQRRKTSWLCTCGNEVVNSISCGKCRHINM